jgi:hypothetical protein
MEDEKGKRSYATSAKGLSFDFVGYKHIDANHYDFSVIVTNFGSKLRSTVYLLWISDYCRPGTVPHLNIIVII